MEKRSTPFKASSPEEIIALGAEYLQTVNTLDFALLFGSHTRGKVTPFSDVDIGIHTTPKLSLLELGGMVTDLEAMFGCPVDVIRLNGLYRDRPAFAMEIVKTGRLMVCPNRRQYVEFKRLTYLFYMDTQWLRDKVKAQFRKRLESGRFGERNYAG